mmetsp:Transcript_50794/g.147996  ORF Transcript_50794/g.147996 Transcript_50794/m.147996 type:complete len:350 (+) Transcript_50794:82-1131(+)
MTAASPIQALLARLSASRSTDSWSMYLPPKLQMLRMEIEANVGVLSREAVMARSQASDAVGGGRPPSTAGRRQQSQATSSSSQDSLLSTGSIPIQGRVWTLSQEACGCRWVQEAIRRGSREEATALASELRGHVVAAAMSPHGNHVMQLCIVTLAPEDCQFIVDEVVEAGVVEVSNNKYGCRIVQRLVEHCPRQQVHEIVDTIVLDALMLSAHPYGNYVAQCVLIHGTPGDRQRIVKIMLDSASQMCRSLHSCRIILAAFEQVDRDEQEALAERLVRQKGLLVNMACSMQGAALVSRLFDVMEGPLRCKAISELAAAAGIVGALGHGQALLARLDIAAEVSATAPGCRQ